MALEQIINGKSILRVLFFSACLFIQPATFSQVTDSITIKGQIIEDASLYSTSKVSLAPYNPDDPYFSTNVNPDGTFNFKIPVSAPRLYDIRYRGYSKYLLLTPSETIINYVMEADADKVRLMKTSGSAENKAYFEFKQAANSFEASLKGFRQDAVSGSNGYQNKVANEITAHNLAMMSLRQQYRSTYVANVLSGMAMVPEIDRSKPLLPQVQRHFLDNVDWGNLQLYKTPELESKLSFYLDNIADTSEAGKIEFISLLYQAVKDSMAARKELTNLLFNELVNNLRENYLQTYVSWALAQAFMAEEMPVIAAKMQLVAKILPGSMAPDVSGEGLNGKTQNLYSVLKSNKITMLLFWESDCSHCKKAMPEFKRLYDAYNGKGFGVFAASMDLDTNKWKQFIDYNRLEWVNINLPAGSPAHADYYIQYTPTMVMIDSHGTILRRFIDVNELEGCIRKALGE